MSSWHTYPSIFSLGHRAVRDLLSVDVNVEEKIDGSQFSFGLVEASEADIIHSYDEGGAPLALKVRSKGAVMHIDAPERMFTKAVKTVRSLVHLLHPGWTYRAEYLAKPKHNALAYDRVPKQHLIIFDVNIGEEAYLSYEEKAKEAERLGLEVASLLYSGRVETIDQFRQFLGTVSALGGQPIEGVVVKPSAYDLFGIDKKVLMGKFVSEAYKEVHSNAWKASNPSNSDILQRLGDMYGTQARWNKSIQHLRELGKLEYSPRDIGPIIREIPEDILKECADEIKERLFSYAWPHIRRMVTRDFPAYYKDLLLKIQFENDLAISGERTDSLPISAGSMRGVDGDNVSNSDRVDSIRGNSDFQTQVADDDGMSI